MECAEMQNPAQAKIDAYQKKVAARKKKDGKANKTDDKKVPTAQANAAVGGQMSLEELMSGIVDISGVAAGTSIGMEPPQVTVDLVETANEGESSEDEEQAPGMLWYVLVPTDHCIPELQCVTVANHLYCDPSTHTPVGFGSDEELARRYHQEAMRSYSNDADDRARAAGATSEFPAAMTSAGVETTRELREGEGEPALKSRTFGNKPLSEQLSQREANVVTTPTFSRGDSSVTSSRNAPPSSASRRGMTTSTARTLEKETLLGPSPLPAYEGANPSRKAAAAACVQNDSGSMPAGATILDVPARQNQVAKSHGARWDSVRKEWWLPAGVDGGPVQEFMWEAERKVNESQRRRLASRIGRMGNAPTPLPTDKPLRTEPEAATLTPMANTSCTPTMAPIDLSASTPGSTLSPISMVNLEEGTYDEKDRRAKRVERRNSSVVLGAVAIALVLFAVLVSGAKLPTDGSAAFSLLAVCLPLRWNSVVDTYESVGERAGTAAAQIAPTMARHTGGVIVLTIALLLTYSSRDGPYHASGTNRSGPDDAAVGGHGLRRKRTTNGLTESGGGKAVAPGVVGWSRYTRWHSDLHLALSVHRRQRLRTVDGKPRRSILARVN